jgi:hypothetical protein
MTTAYIPPYFPPVGPKYETFKHIYKLQYLENRYISRTPKIVEFNSSMQQPKEVGSNQGRDNR